MVIFIVTFVHNALRLNMQYNFCMSVHCCTSICYVQAFATIIIIIYIYKYIFVVYFLRLCGDLVYDRNFVHGDFAICYCRLL